MTAPLLNEGWNHSDSLENDAVACLNNFARALHPHFGDHVYYLVHTRAIRIWYQIQSIKDDHPPIRLEISTDGLPQPFVGQYIMDISRTVNGLPFWKQLVGNKLLYMGGDGTWCLESELPRGDSFNLGADGTLFGWRPSDDISLPHRRNCLIRTFCADQCGAGQATIVRASAIPPPGATNMALGMFGLGCVCTGLLSLGAVGLDDVDWLALFAEPAPDCLHPETSKHLLEVLRKDANINLSELYSSCQDVCRLLCLSATRDIHTREHALVYDWDDTLFCSAAMKHYKDKHIPVDIRAALKKIEKAACEVLRLSLQRGPTFIVTAACRAWVFQVSEKYMPNLLPLLDGAYGANSEMPTKVRVLSATEEEASDEELQRLKRSCDCSDMEIANWKGRVLCSLQQSFKFKYMSAFGDKQADMMALDVVTKHSAPSPLTRGIKLKECPSATDLIEQLQVVADNFRALVGQFVSPWVVLERSRECLSNQYHRSFRLCDPLSQHLLEVHYSDIFTRCEFEYRVVYLPLSAVEPTLREQPMLETQWRSLGVNGLSGWQHFRPKEMNWLRFCRVAGTDPATGQLPSSLEVESGLHRLYSAALKNSACPPEDLVAVPEWGERIEHCTAYQEDSYECKFVIVPPELLETIPAGRCMVESEWRSRGICQSRGWEHVDEERRHFGDKSLTFPLFFRRAYGSLVKNYKTPKRASRDHGSAVGAAPTPARAGV